MKVTRRVAKHRKDPLVKALGKAAEVGDQPPMIALSGATIAFGFFRGDARMTRAGLRMLAAHALATGIKTIIKRSIDRTRPDEAIDNGGHEMKKGKSKRHELSSFPSGHTAGAVAVARAAVRDYPGIAVPAYTAAAAVAAIQIPRCKHFVTDIAVGAAIGLAAEALVSRVFPSPEGEGDDQIACFNASTRSVFSQVNRSPSALRPKWP